MLDILRNDSQFLIMFSCISSILQLHHLFFHVIVQLEHGLLFAKYRCQYVLTRYNDVLHCWIYEHGMLSLRKKKLEMTLLTVLQMYASEYFHEISELLRRLPRVILLMMKTNDCLRAVNNALVRTISCFSSTAIAKLVIEWLILFKQK